MPEITYRNHFIFEVYKQTNSAVWTSSLYKNNVHLPFSVFFLIYLSLRIPAAHHSLLDILPQLRTIPTVTHNTLLHCYPSFLPHIIPIELRKLSSYRWTNILFPDQSASCIISHTVTAVSFLRSYLNLSMPISWTIRARRRILPM